MLPTPIFFFGPEPDVEFDVKLEAGKTLLVTYRAMSEADNEGRRTVFFDLNGQPRTVRISDRSRAAAGLGRRRAEDGNPAHVGAPMPGLIAGVAVRAGDKVARGAPLFTIEAMKMESAVYAESAGVVREIAADAGHRVEAGDLVMIVDAGE